MQPQRISIPNAKPENPACDAADIVISKLRQMDIDPVKAEKYPIAVSALQGWVRGEYTDAQVERIFANLLIFNPGMALK